MFFGLPRKNSKPHTIRNYELVLTRFCDQFGDRVLKSLMTEIVSKNIQVPETHFEREVQSLPVVQGYFDFDRAFSPSLSASFLFAFTHSETQSSRPKNSLYFWKISCLISEPLTPSIAFRRYCGTFS